MFFLLLLALAAAPAPAAQVARKIVSDNGDPILYPSYLTLYDGSLFFRANNLTHGNNVELWAFDGDVARMVADINPGSAGSDPSYLAAYNGTLYFCAHGATGGSRLWQYDPVNGAALAPGSSAQASLPQELFAFAGKLCFRATRFSDVGTELWTFDGSYQTPIDIYSGTGSAYPQHFVEYNSLMYFNANGTPGQGAELWRYNGSGMPAEAARIYPGNGSSPEQFAVYAGQLYFSAYDGVHGRELWRYDGTTASLAADIAPGDNSDSSNPSGLTVYSNRLYFSANDGVHGNELWSFDGTGAQMVAEINPTPDPGNGDDFLMDSSPAGFTVFNGLLYFSADDGTHGRELWSYDGTTAQLVLDINPGQYGSEVTELTVYDGALYFSADNAYVLGETSLQPKAFVLAPMTLEDALDTTGVVWSTGSHPWFPQTNVTHDGVDAAQSGQAHNADDQPWLRADNITGPGSVSFRWKADISCGAFANFRVSGGTGVWPQSIDLNATTDWRWETCFFGEGSQTLFWVAYGNCDDPDQITVRLDEVVIAGPGRETDPFFTTQIADRTVPAGTNITLKAVAAGYPIPSLQWYFQGAPIPGATNYTLELTNVQAEAAGLYSIVASTESISITNRGTLTVLDRAPVILVPPEDQTATIGLTAQFGVIAQGSSPLSYQWQFNGIDLAGETGPALTLSPVAPNQGGGYSVVVRNPIGSTPSPTATLAVVQVAAWGEDAFGQIDVPSNACDVVAVAAGSGHSLALKRDGTVLAWGDTTWNAQSSIPADLTNAIRIAAGGWHSLALRSDGTVAAWGFYTHGQTNVPAGLSNVVAIAGGLSHSVALKADGRVAAWGDEAAAEPEVADTLEGVSAIAAGFYHNLALLSNGTVFAWGENQGQQCDVPADLSNIVAVAAGEYHSLALRSDGTVVAWGTNTYGQAEVPDEVTNIVAIAAGGGHNLAREPDGTLLAWGDDRYGQVDIPEGLAGVASMSGGRAHTVALLGLPPAVDAPTLVPYYFPDVGQISISVLTVPGRTYYLETSLWPTDPDWVAVAAAFGDGTEKTFTQPAAGPQQFFRVRVE